MQAERIAIVVDTLSGGGAEKVCLTLVQAMRERGLDAQLIVLRRHVVYDLPQSLPVHFIYEDPGVKLHRRRIQGDAAGRLRALAARLGGFGLTLAMLQDSYSITARAGLPNCWYVVHNSIENKLARARRRGYFRYRRMRRAVSALDDKRVITVSRGLRGEIERSPFLRPASVTTIYNPLDVEHVRQLSLRPETGIPDEPYIIFVGRMARQKRVDILLQAFEQVQSDVSLVMLGPASKKLGRLIKRMNQGKRVFPQGFKQNPYPWIRNARALVLSSDFEGLPTVLAEALACDTPVVSTDCPHGPSEILRGALRRFLVPPRSPALLAQKIDEAIAHPELFRNSEVLQEFAPHKVVREYASLIGDTAAAD